MVNSEFPEVLLVLSFACGSYVSVKVGESLTNYFEGKKNV